MTWRNGPAGVKRWVGPGRPGEPAPEPCRLKLDGIRHVNHGSPCCPASEQLQRELVSA